MSLCCVMLTTPRKAGYLPQKKHTIQVDERHDRTVTVEEPHNQVKLHRALDSEDVTITCAQKQYSWAAKKRSKYFSEVSTARLSREALREGIDRLFSC